MKSNIIAYVPLALLLSISACAAISAATASATFKPFVRSRYSVRWRQTTTQSTVFDNKTITTDGTGMNSKGRVDDSEPATTKLIRTNPQHIVTSVIEEETISHAAAATIIQSKEKDHIEILTSTIHPKQKSSTLPMDYDYYNNGEADDLNNK